MAETIVVHVRDCPPGWERDPRYVYVGRAGHGFDGRWGNSHRVGWCTVCLAEHERGQAMEAHWRDVSARWDRDPAYREAVEGLRGKILVCFCAPRPCHAGNYVRLLGERDRLRSCSWCGDTSQCDGHCQGKRL